MNNYSKFAIFAMLALTITIGIAYAQPVPIGQTVQPVPFESSPTATANFHASPSSTGMMMDGDLGSPGSISSYASGMPAPSTAWFELKTFKTPATPEWDPEWVEIKMKADGAALTGDDTYRIEYTVGAASWQTLQSDVTGPFATAIRPWSQLVEPNDGAWTWGDIADLRVRVFFTKKGFAWDNKKMWINEVWATVYPAPPPPISSTTLSVQPLTVTRVRPYDYMLGGVQGVCFVEVYVNEVADLFGYQFRLSFDTRVLTPTEAFSYYPWTSVSRHDLDDAGGFVEMSYTIPPPVGTGEAFYGSSPLARIYFYVDAYGGGAGGGATADLTISIDPLETILTDPDANRIDFTAYNSWFSGSRYLSSLTGYAGGDPTDTTWHEMYPQYSNTYTITGWSDTDLSGDITHSDQIEMYNETDGTTKEYHVDDVTVTIHWTFKDPPYGEGAAEPLEPLEPPILSPYGYWHQIWPPDQFCRWFEITSWDETGTPGEPGVFDSSDQFDFYYLDEGVTYWAHLDDVTTDILVSEKGPPPMPEFPLGISLLMLLAPLIPLTYLWRLRKKVTKQ